VGVAFRNKHPNPNQNAIADDDDDDEDEDEDEDDNDDGSTSSRSVIPLGYGYLCGVKEANRMYDWSAKLRRRDRYKINDTEVMSWTTSRWMSHIIDNHKVAIFSKSECPVCESTIALFKEIGVEEDVVILELDLMRTGDRKDFSNELFNRTAQTTFPSVFVMQQHIGDNDDTQAAIDNGQLENLLGI
jgi:glutaredoxin 3